MHMLKLLFQELKVQLTTPGRDSRPPGAQLRTTTQRQLTTQGKNAAVV